MSINDKMRQNKYLFQNGKTPQQAAGNSQIKWKKQNNLLISHRITR